MSRLSCFFFSECLTVIPVIPEAAVSQRQGPAGICSSTLEKLRGFTCLSEPSINFSYSERDHGAHEGSGEKATELKSQVPRPLNATQQPINKSSRCQPEQENDDEEEQEQEEDGSRPALSKKVPERNMLLFFL